MLSLVGIVATVWLALTGQLGLYIHPRYFIFTVALAIIALVFVLLAFAIIPRAESEQHDHDSIPVTPRGRAWGVGGSVILVALTAAALLVLPPVTLTTATVEQRDMNGSASATALSASETLHLAGGDDSGFTVRDWAGLLRQGADADFLSGRIPDLVGFVTPDPDDPENVFYIARFVVTCCAVDAQPIGVPVYLPGWQDQFAIDEWVAVSGSFIENPSIDSMQATVLDPHSVSPTEQPSQPYVY